MASPSLWCLQLLLISNALCRTSFFLIGFYTLSLVCFTLIVKFGVLQANNPPSPTLRGLYVLSSVIAGAAGGGIAIFFWKATRYFIGGWGGLAFGLFIQCVRNGGLIVPVGFRWIMYIGKFLQTRLIDILTQDIFRMRSHRILSMHNSQASLSRCSGIDCLCRRYFVHVGCRLLHNCRPQRG